MVQTRNASSGRYILIVEDSKGRRTIPLEDTKYSLGRQGDNDIIIYSKQASRKHATLVRKSSNQYQGYTYWILDGDLEGNKSYNGIYVNGEKCLIHELKNGDLINFGCEINASYHTLVNSVETFTPTSSIQGLVNPLWDDSQNSGVLNPQQRNTLILSEAHVTSSNDDTIQDQASLDLLTELPNRSLFHGYLSIALGNAKRNQTPLVVIFIDIDKFKLINRKLGVSIGDRVLQEFAQNLKLCLRSADIVARWGGDEFTVLLPHVNSVEDIPGICKRIFSKFSQPIQIDKHEIYLNVKMGLGIYPQDGNEGINLLKKAESSLEQSKPQPPAKNIASVGKNSKLAKIKTSLHKALKEQEFELYYQPQVNITNGEITGIEALLRWHHPEYGEIAPNQLIPWAERTDVMFMISEWILETACRQHQAWQKLHLNPFPVSVNLSSKELTHPELLSRVSRILSETELAPDLLSIEITEKTLLEKAEDSLRVLHEMKYLGIKVSLDDFGVGFTSVSHLQQFPFSQVKIAQALIQLLKHTPQETTMIAAVIGLARTFNITVVAEGVETQQQLDILRQLGCQLMQGYRFSPPLNAEDATQFLSLHQLLSPEVSHL